MCEGGLDVTLYPDKGGGRANASSFADAVRLQRYLLKQVVHIVRLTTATRGFACDLHHLVGPNGWRLTCAAALATGSRPKPR